MDDDIRIRAAWLYHVGGLSQDEVGQRLGLSRFKVLRCCLTRGRRARLSCRWTIEAPGRWRWPKRCENDLA